MHLKSIVLIACSLVITACEDKNVYVSFYDKSIKKIPCLSLDNSLKPFEGSLQKEYNFKENCPYKLVLASATNIVCKSPFNASTKTTTNFPSSYIELDIKKGIDLIYSYYKDLTHETTKDDIQDGFKRLKRDILE